MLQRSLGWLGILLGVLSGEIYGVPCVPVVSPDTPNTMYDQPRIRLLTEGERAGREFLYK